jgi:predicted Rossmann fold nucleotide-binding protein DprA/Smf involved in DNA uptake
MKIGIVGSRYFTNYEAFRIIMKQYRSRFEFDMIISGGAVGVDELAYRYAVQCGITFVCHPPKLSEGIPAAYRRRNLRIIEMSEIVIALPMGESNGTRHSISLAKRLGKELHVIELQQRGDT